MNGIEESHTYCYVRQKQQFCCIAAAAPIYGVYEDKTW